MTTTTEPVDGAALLTPSTPPDPLRRPPVPAATDAVVLWIAASHAQPAWPTPPAWSSAHPNGAAANPGCWTWSRRPATTADHRQRVPGRGVSVDH